MLFNTFPMFWSAKEINSSSVEFWQRQIMRTHCKNIIRHVSFGRHVLHHSWVLDAAWRNKDGIHVWMMRNCIPESKTDGIMAESALSGNSQCAAQEGDTANLLEEAEEGGSSSVSSDSKMLIGILVLTHSITCRFVLCTVPVAELISTDSFKLVVRMWNPYGTVHHFLDYVPKPDWDAGVCHWMRWFLCLPPTSVIPLDLFFMCLLTHLYNSVLSPVVCSSPLRSTLPNVVPFHVQDTISFFSWLPQARFPPAPGLHSFYSQQVSSL